ncbi:MAG TPA: hypothetical protein VK853_06055 [Ilumatobacteraceae bacterium]|nr:hypothetical protein [Ilumatobacteraceae bacterium]
MGPPVAPPEILDEIELSDGRTMVVRTTIVDDAAAIGDLYGSLTMADRHRRFFGAFVPRDEWCRTWATVAERGGFGVVAVVDGVLVAEAGYALRDDGDGDLAVTVDVEWRGWLGPYLLDVLVRHAAEHGVRNLQAEVLLENGPMLSLLRRRDPVALAHDDGMVRLSIGTSGTVAAWPPGERRRKVLVEVPGRRWSGETAADSADLAVAMCAGPDRRERHPCPVLTGGTCELARDADAIVMLLDPDDETSQELIDAHHRNSPGVPVFVRHATQGEEPLGCLELDGDGPAAVEQILSVLGRSRP